MASITPITNKAGTVYRAYVCINKQRLSATRDTEIEALIWAKETEDRMKNGLPLPGEEPNNDLVFSNAVNLYLTKKTAQKANTRRLNNSTAGRLITFFDGKNLKDISGKDITEYREYRLGKVGPSSVLQDFSFISKLYKTAKYEWGIDVDNPTVGVDKPSPPKSREIVLSKEEINSLLEAAKQSTSEKLYPYLMTLLNTGMRPSEAAGLKRYQIDLDKGLIDLPVTKTKPRKVPLIKNIKPILSELLTSLKTPDEWVFLPPKSTKKTIPSNYFRRSFKNACREAKLKNKVSLYTMRHTAISWMIMCGIDIVTVAAIVGHSDIKTTQRYTHLLDDHKSKKAEKLNKLFEENENE